MTYLRIAVLLFWLAGEAIGQQANIYANQFAELKDKTDALYREFSEPGHWRSLLDKRYPSLDAMLYATKKQPLERALSIHNVLLELERTIGKALEQSNPEMQRLYYLQYACGSLSLVLDSLEHSAWFGVSGDRYLELAAAQQLAVGLAFTYASDK